MHANPTMRGPIAVSVLTARFLKEVDAAFRYSIRPVFRQQFDPRTFWRVIQY